MIVRSLDIVKTNIVADLVVRSEHVRLSDNHLTIDSNNEISIFASFKREIQHGNLRSLSDTMADYHTLGVAR